MRILLYCTFVNDYIKLLPNWLKYTASNFYTDNTDVLIMTDDTTYISNEDRIKIKYVQSKERAELLFDKFHMHLDVIEEYKDKYDIFAHLQANCLLTRKVEHGTLPFVYNKLNCFTHLTWPNCRAILDHSVVQKGSVAYKNLQCYGDTYLQASMLLGDYASIKKMCTECIQLYEIDKAAGQLSKAPYYDESYLNAWVVDNKDIVNIITGVVDYGDIDCFHCSPDVIYITSKREAGIIISKGIRVK